MAFDKAALSRSVHRHVKHPDTGKPWAILDVGNAKTWKGTKFDYLTGVLYLAPANRADPARTVCPWAKRCIRPCLTESGFGSQVSVKDARIRKTLFFLNRRKEFVALLHEAIKGLVDTAAANGLRPALRLNGTSDIAWESIEGGILAKDFGDRLIRYEYSKGPNRVSDWLHGTPSSNPDWPYARSNGAGAFRDVRNYALVFSLGGKHDDQIPALLKRGANVAAAWKSKKMMPAMSSGFVVPGGGTIKFDKEYPVIDGDSTDLRFADPSPAIVGLSAKDIAFTKGMHSTSQLDTGEEKFFLENPSRGRRSSAMNAGCGSAFGGR